jgi:excisionase family DNA binding protein
MKMRRRRKAGTLYNPNALLKKATLRIDETAALMAVHQDTVRRWLADGKLSSERTPGGQHRIRTALVRKFL